MKNNILKKMAVAGLVAGILTSCTKNLDLKPTNGITADVVYSTPAGYKQAFAKLYGSYALTGNTGPSGDGDVQGIDEGTSDFFRLYWNAQELTTDEAVCAWGDPGVPDLHKMNWTSDNPILKGLYYRSYYQITLCNDFINQSSDATLTSKGFAQSDIDAIKQYRYEARFLRAYQYSILMDLFGNVPFATEKDAIGTFLPKQIARADLFTYIESELKAIAPSLVAAKTNEYGRADQAAAWALLARIYLNAQVYTGTARWTDAVTYASKVISAGYVLVNDYRWLMRADNNKNTSEFILTINYDGLKTQGYGGTTFLAHSSLGGSMNAGDYALDYSWAGNRTTKSLVNLFPDMTGAKDQRAEFYTPGQNLDINDLTVFTDGIGINKFVNRGRPTTPNILTTGAPGSNQTFCDIDMPIFRLAEMYLIYAEAVLRGGTGGDAVTALGYINSLRQRAYGNVSGNILPTQLTTDFILDERARELYWEGFRRTDLIRYNKFVESAYLWPWKGGVKDGTSVGAFRVLFPLPSADVSANTNLKQNPGY
ncbi:MAG: RagB/SusD family nutrient uptake outer membrane protein [Sphingobacteriia bacterium]|nr:RagB/SusD family nutrient uptake outer membrane protein [Sphingobacteriia bacterium]